jgi:4,5-dihydroxyphthalate decarboxylase
MPGHVPGISLLSGKIPAMTADRIPQLLSDGRLHLTLAVSDYDHVRDLVHGVVRPEGIALTALVLPIEEIFYRFIHRQEWDISEVSFAKYTALTAQGSAPMVGIPVFPSRVFRHSAIYVRADRNIQTPKDLENRAVGIPEWAQTAGIYARGFLAEDYGVDLTAIRWVQAGMNQAGRAEKVALNLPAGIRYESRPDASLSELLLKGELDAAITAREPDAFVHGEGRIVRLFPDYRKEEEAYHRRTGIFPIMHVIAMRRAVFERYPWAAMNLFKAFEEAKQRSVERVADITASRIPLPWSAALSAGFGAAFGADPFPYGIAANRVTLDAFCRFAHAQGITHGRMKPEDLFPAEVHKSVRV